MRDAKEGRCGAGATAGSATAAGAAGHMPRKINKVIPDYTGAASRRGPSCSDAVMPGLIARGYFCERTTDGWASEQGDWPIIGVTSNRQDCRSYLEREF